MNLPDPDDYIDIHSHGALSARGQFSVENLMAHEDRVPDNQPGLSYTFGIHPWHLSAANYKQQIDKVVRFAEHSNVAAIGESGFDRLKGPEESIQKATFEDQVKIAEERSKPLYIHCVRAWDELLSENRRLKPSTPWLIHGFRGKKELALQLISKGMYLSFWFDFILRPESTPLIKSLPKEKIFLETDGAEIDIRTIYEKVANDLDMSVDGLKATIFSNFKKLFK